MLGVGAASLPSYGATTSLSLTLTPSDEHAVQVHDAEPATRQTPDAPAADRLLTEVEELRGQLESIRSKLAPSRFLLWTSTSTQRRQIAAAFSPGYQTIA